MPDPSAVISSVGTQLWLFFTQIGGVGIIWIVGLYLCYSRRELPQTPRMLIAISLGIQLFSTLMFMFVWPLLIQFLNRNGNYTGDASMMFKLMSTFSGVMRMLAQGLMLYAIFGNFRRRPNWDAMAMETPGE